MIGLTDDLCHFSSHRAVCCNHLAQRRELPLVHTAEAHIIWLREADGVYTYTSVDDDGLLHTNSVMFFGTPFLRSEHEGGGGGGGGGGLRHKSK